MSTVVVLVYVDLLSLIESYVYIIFMTSLVLLFLALKDTRRMILRMVASLIFFVVSSRGNVWLGMNGSIQV